MALDSTNLSALAPATTAVGALSNLVLAVPQIFNGLRSGDQYTIGYQPGFPPEQKTDSTAGIIPQLPPPFIFNYEGEQTVTFESDITDHFIEDNTAIQDQIALPPEIITTHGFIGELNNVPPKALALIQQAANTLTTISAYVPSLSTTALLAYAEAFQLYQVGAKAVNSAVAAISSISGQGGEAVVGDNGITNGNLPTQSKQQQAFQLFYGYWRNRVLFTVQTPWAVFLNCAIKSVRAIQDADTNMITDFNVTFKVIRTASTQISFQLSTGRRNAQSSSLVNLGFNATTPGPSLSTAFSGAGFGSL